MAEVVALVTQISGIINNAHGLVGWCCDVTGAIANVPEEILAVRSEVTTFEYNIRQLQSFVNTHPNDAQRLAYLNEPNGTLETAMAVVKQLMILLEIKEFSPMNSDRQIRLTTLKQLQWALKKTEVRELLEKLGRCRSSIDSHLIIMLTQQVYDLREGLDETNQGISDIIKEQTESLTLEVMKPGDPRGYRIFRWATGLPGTGKTILAYFIIEQTLDFFKTKGVTYYYCHHARSQDESIPFLKYVVKGLMGNPQLYVPSLVYERHKIDRELDAEDFLACLAELSLKFLEGVHIIVDAVDESRPRDNLLDVLVAIGTEQRFRNVSLMVTSRPEPDIMAKLEHHGRSRIEISMCNQGVRADIRRVVHTELRNTPWSDEFRKDVENTLVQGARGMFRWVACQLDLIKRLARHPTNGEQAIREELNNLPGDIFATYERILLEIDDVDKPFARTALALICCKNANIPTAEILVEACLYNVRHGHITKYNINLFANIFGSLIRIYPCKTPRSVFNTPSTEPAVHSQASLAHYTVAEYLRHPDTSKGAAAFFYLSEDDLDTIDLLVGFNGLQYFGLGRVTATKARITRFEEHCLKKTEQAFSNRRRSTILEHDELYEAVLRSLRSTSPHAAWIRQQNGIVRVMRDCFPTWFGLITQLEVPIVGEFCDQVGTLLNIVHLKWFDMARKYLESQQDFTRLRRNDKVRFWTTSFKLEGEHNTYETILTYCVRNRMGSFLNLFISYGASFQYESEILYAAMYNPEKDETTTTTTLHLLHDILDFGRGAIPNPVPAHRTDRHRSPDRRTRSKMEFAFTPLQVAVALLEHEWVDALLTAYAEPNKTGMNGGQIPHGYDRGKGIDCKYLCSIGERTPLEICRMARPRWLRPGHAKGHHEIDLMLTGWGAKIREVENDRMAIDLTGEMEE
ncbi:hypothetical protein SUNI508_03949 [Seiridium unicorne]|uniref:Nephrocystin 3-like N-terminal domain-containing protein n=1 Tax=Seiridium unicorne TaxID=138068 RepID=A0ABR2VAK4_9PEZI